MIASKPLLELELRPVEGHPLASPGATVFVLLPSLDELVGSPGFGSVDPICLPGSARPYRPQTLFEHASRPTLLH